MRTERSRIGKVPVIASSLSLTGCRMRAVVLGHGLQGARFESHDAVASYSGEEEYCFGQPQSRRFPHPSTGKPQTGIALT